MFSSEYKIQELTSLQKGIVYEALRENNPSLYVVQMTLQFNTCFNISFFEQAFSFIVNRYDSLRSALAVKESQYLLAIYDLNVPIISYDLCHDQQGSRIYNDYLTKDLTKGFDLFTPPLMRLANFKISENVTKVVWTRHHLLLDGSSALKLLKEILGIYRLLAKGGSLPCIQSVLKEPINTNPNQAGRDSSKSYWEAALKNPMDAGLMPPRSLSLQQNSVPRILKKVKRSIAGAKFNELIAFSRGQFFSVNTLLKASWGILLSAYCGKSSIQFGSVMAYPREAVGESIGLFINTLPVVLNIDGNQRVSDYLRVVKDQGELLKANINTPLSKIKEWCHLPSDQALYQSLVDYKPYDINELLKLEFPELDCQVDFTLNTPYPFVLEANKANPELKVEIIYDSRLYKKAHAEAIIDFFVYLLTSLSSFYLNKITEIPTFSQEQFKKIIEGNNTVKIIPNKTLHELFEEQVAKTPFNKALVYGSNHLAYKDLNVRANQLANYLTTFTVKEKPVAIYLEASSELYISILAILKAGASYIPLDPSYPAARIKQILTESAPELIITQSSSKDLFAEYKTIMLNEIELGNYSANNLNLTIPSANLAYIIYTSGSTGKPRGVAVEHHSVVNMALECQRQFSMNDSKKALQVSALGFDVAVAEWTMALLSGAALYLIDKKYFFPDHIADQLAQNKITSLICTVAILSTLPKIDLPYLDTIGVGGESIHPSVVDFWASGRSFLNIYGITETTVCSTMKRCSPGQTEITVGKPIANTQVYVLTSWLQPSPLYAVGEIYIGGVGLARGYYRDDEATKKSFIQLPFLSERCYKTNDLGSFVEAGELQFLGRLDNQVKIRGFRVNLEEIGSLLESCPGVKRAIIIPKINLTSTTLLAFVIPDKRLFNLLDLRNYCVDHLPAFMIPSSFFQINEIPLTLNGKVDNKKLLEMESTQSREVKQTKCVGNKYEAFIIQCIHSLINYEVALNENFMSIGIDSLGLVELALKLKKINNRIDVMTLFTYTTVEQLAKHIEQLDETSSEKLEEREYHSKSNSNSRIIFEDE